MPLLRVTPYLILISQSHRAHGAEGLCFQSDYRHGSGTYAHCGKANTSKTSQFEGQYNGLYVDKRVRGVLSWGKFRKSRCLLALPFPYVHVRATCHPIPVYHVRLSLYIFTAPKRLPATCIRDSKATSQGQWRSAVLLNNSFLRIRFESCHGTSSFLQ